MGLAELLFGNRKKAQPKDLGSGFVANAATDLTSRKQYNDYVISMNENGEKALPYEQWMAGKK